jgi:hypothetical protein
MSDSGATGAGEPGSGLLGLTDRGFGDGSNRWIPGLIETARNPVDRATNPFETVTGAADAAALNFDEGVGGLVSLVDDEPGNAAGPGTDATGDPGGSNVANQGILAGEGVDGLQLIVFGAVLVALLYLARPVLEIAADVSAEVTGE